MRACMIPIADLVAHERVSKKRVHELVQSLREEQTLKEPIVVAKDFHIVLDGHHRVAALKILGSSSVPAYVVDYFSKEISVQIRRKKLLEQLIKESVISYAKQGIQFPYKTTKHTIRSAREHQSFPLASCK